MEKFNHERRCLLRRAVVVFAVILGLASSIAFSAYQPAHAAGNPPPNSNTAPAGGTDNLHGTDHSLARDAHRNKARGVTSPDGVTPLSSTITETAPIIFVHGINAESTPGGGGFGGPGAAACTGAYGLWTNPTSYLSSLSHPGLGGDSILPTSSSLLKTVGFYNRDVRCSFNLSTYNHAWVPACDGVAGISNSDPKVGTNNEPIEHVACELAWYIYTNWTSHGQNVKVVAHSMGGLIIRYAIQMMGHDSHFPSSLRSATSLPSRRHWEV